MMTPVGIREARAPCYKYIIVIRGLVKLFFFFFSFSFYLLIYCFIYLFIYLLIYLFIYFFFFFFFFSSFKDFFSLMCGWILALITCV